MNKLTMLTADGTNANVEKLAALFPNCVTEVRGADGELKHAVDFDRLRQELQSSVVEGNEERYQFTWPDKRKAQLTANAPITATLRPCREESVDFDNTQNLYIEGDNLQVLKLLRENYLGKVKMIYIDPPYNTGNDFVYNDNFDQDKQEYVHNSGQYDEEGNQQGVGVVSGGADTFFSKNKARSYDAFLARATKWFAIGFVVVVLALNIIAYYTTPADAETPADSTSVTATADEA